MFPRLELGTKMVLGINRGWKPKGFLIDENLSMTQDDEKKFGRFRVINSKSKFKKGTSDALLIRWVKETGFTLATKDVRMAILALSDGASVLLVNEDFQIITLIRPQVVDKDCFKDIYDYFRERLDGFED